MSGHFKYLLNRDDRNFFTVEKVSCLKSYVLQGGFFDSNSQKANGQTLMNTHKGRLSTSKVPNAGRFRDLLGFFPVLICVVPMPD